MSLFGFEFMQRALLAGLMVGLAAPSIGIYIVQRRLSLLGDGIGHVAFTGVAAGFLLEVSPIITAIIFAIAGAVAIELLRERDKTSGDVALALIFYGGIAGGVLLISLSGESTAKLGSYLFGSVVTVSTSDLRLIVIVSAVVLLMSSILRKHLFAVAYDEDVAKASGLPVRTLNILTAATVAIVIAITAKVVGILLVSSLLVLPVAAVQLLTKTFRSTVYTSMLLGASVSVGGLVIAYYLDVLPAATIVLSAIACYAFAFLLQKMRHR